MTYTHSKDYLIELAYNSQTQGWLNSNRSLEKTSCHFLMTDLG